MRAETLDVACTDVEPARRALRRTALALLLCAACSGGWATAFAAQGTAEADAPTEVGAPAEGGGPAEGAAPVAGLSQSDAANIVRQAYGGRIVAVVEATLDAREGGKPMRGHRIRVDVDGRVKTVFVDASGRIHEDAVSTPRGRPGRPE